MVVTDSSGTVVGGNWVNVIPNYHPILSTVPDQIVSTGDAVDVSTTASDMSPNGVYEGYVDWGDGTGLYPTSFDDSGTSANLTAHLDAAGDPGENSASLSICSANESFNHSGLGNSAGFNIDVAGITINNLPQDQKQSPGAILVTDPGDPAASFEPVTLTVPDALPTGTIVKLSINDSAMSEAQVLQGQTAAESDAVILGGAGDGATDMITWTKGSGTLPWQNLWIEPLAESGSQADIVLSLEVDAPSTQITPPVTGKSTDHANATSYDPRIMYTPDQANATAVDITGKTDSDATPILVGQRVSLSISSNLAQNFDWTMEGDTFKDYVVAPDASTGKVVRLGEGDITQRNLTYYYEPTFTGNLLVECTFTINGQSYRREAAFNVYQPTSTFSMQEGRINFFKNGADTIFGMKGSSSIQRYGMNFTASVDTSKLPTPLDAEGQFYMTQIITSANVRIFDSPGVVQIKSQFGAPALDIDPRKLGGARYQNILYGTGTTGSFYDSPANDLKDYYGLQQIYNSRDDSFNDYLMFVPAGSNSKPVALRETSFSWHGVVTRILGDWILDAQLSARVPKVDQIDSMPASAQPVWFENNHSKEWIFIPDVLPPG